MNRGLRFRRGLVVGGALVLFLACPVWIRSLCKESKAEPPGHGYDGQHGWAFYGREALHGPQALAGTWYNLPGPRDPADDAGDGACPAACAPPGKWKKWLRRAARAGGCVPDGCCLESDVGGSWFWVRSPEQERVVVAGLYNRYCVRCHGADGRGVWDMPGVPDFTNTRWQVTRSDDQIARIIIEGRGAVMPPFRGTLTLEEAWAMARYLRTFVPGTEASRPDVGPPAKAGKATELPAPKSAK
jgi:hypothetical protein